MNREQAEKLLAAMIFDDLDEPSKAELLAYLQTDDELRDRLTDLRMTVKLTSDAVNDGPDPVLNKQRLKQLKRLSKAHKAEMRFVSMRRLLSVAAVMAFGLVMVGLLMPSLNRSSPQSGRVAWEAEQRLRSLSETLESSPDASYLRMSDSEAKRRPAPQMGRGRVEMGGSAGNGATDSYVNLGGATAMGEKDAVAMSGGGIYSTNGSSIIHNTPFIENATIVPNAGQGIGGAVPFNSDESPVAVHTGPTPAPSSTMGRGQNVAQPRGLEKLDEEQVAQIMSGMPGRTDIRQLPPMEPTSTVVSDAAPTQPSDADRFEFNAGFAGTAKPPSGPEGRTQQDYGWQGGLLEKPARPARSPTATEPVASSERKTNEALGVEVIAGVDASSRVAPVQMQPVPPVPSIQTTDHAVILDMQEAGVPYSNGLTYPKNWRELMAEQETGVSPDADGDGIPLPSHFQVVPVNPWVMTDRDALSTFALDVDTASYALCRQYIRNGTLPPIGAVRMEEFINAFDYAYPQRDGATFAVYAEGAPSPFAPAGQDVTLLKIAVKARTVGRDQRRPAHIVFVVDASASMGQADRLPLVQGALNLLVDKLSEADRVSLITCANEARLHLEAVPARQRDAIRQTIEAVQPAGPTNLMAGLELGYAIARRAFVAGQINQVVLCSDGVANVGETEAQAVLGKVAEDRKQGITLTCVGVGHGAYNDAFLEALANRGDGRYVFLDSSEQAGEALVNQLAATLQVVAKDARIQVEFNPTRVRRYRLIGYENRDIEDERFRDDTVDAGEVGSGQCSTALYELELTTPSRDGGDDLGTVFVRYRHAETGQIEEISRSLAGSIVRRRSVAEDPRFFLAAGAARFAEWLRESEHARNTNLADVQRLLNDVSAALPLDKDVQDLADLTRQAQGLPRAPQP